MPYIEAYRNWFPIKKCAEKASWNSASVSQGVLRKTVFASDSVPISLRGAHVRYHYSTGRLICSSRREDFGVSGPCDGSYNLGSNGDLRLCCRRGA